MFPSLSSELRRLRALALEIPDPVLRRIALQALECKRCNQEGAAAFELLSGRHSSSALIRGLYACQAMCDYLDVLCEQPVVEDPIANGYRLHEALIAALDVESPAQPSAYYYAHGSYSHDGGYLQTLIDDVRVAVRALPSRTLVQGPLRGAAQRIATYQSFNHGDSDGSLAPFRRWAREQVMPGSGISWWEAAAGAGSTLLVFALMACAARPKLSPEDVIRIEDAYLPWFGALHTLLDSLVDLDEDHLTGGHQLVACYRSAEHATERLGALAAQALQRTAQLPRARRHGLLLVAMTGFYLCQAQAATSEHEAAIRSSLMQTIGGLVRPATLIMGARHAAQRPARESTLLAAAK